MKELCDSIISQSITSAIITGVKMNAPTIRLDQGPVMVALSETNANLGILAASIEGQTTTYTRQEQPSQPNAPLPFPSGECTSPFA
jgi:hypothetical protein